MRPNQQAMRRIVLRLFLLFLSSTVSASDDAAAFSIAMFLRLTVIFHALDDGNNPSPLRLLLLLLSPSFSLSAAAKTHAFSRSFFSSQAEEFDGSENALTTRSTLLHISFNRTCLRRGFVSENSRLKSMLLTALVFVELFIFSEIRWRQYEEECNAVSMCLGHFL